MKKQQTNRKQYGKRDWEIKWVGGRGKLSSQPPQSMWQNP
jgi:hypothetical protein